MAEEDDKITSGPDKGEAVASSSNAVAGSSHAVSSESTLDVRHRYPDPDKVQEVRVVGGAGAVTVVESKSSLVRSTPVDVSPIYNRETLEHLTAVFRCWRSLEVGADTIKAMIIDKKGRTFLIPCEMGEKGNIDGSHDVASGLVWRR